MACLVVLMGIFSGFDGGFHGVLVVLMGFLVVLMGL